MLVGITGATGFLGHYIVNHLLAAGHRCRCWFRPEADRGGFPDVGDRLEWVPGKLNDEAANVALSLGVDAIVHAAVEWSPGGAGEAVHFGNVNVLGSLRLMQAARAANVPRFVFISTCGVHDVILPDRKLDEAHPLWMRSHYGAHKAAIEAFVHSYGLGSAWDICALRPTGIYGLERRPSESRWMNIVKDVLAGKPIESAAGGKEVHAADVAKAVEILLTAKGVAGQSYNCYDQYVAVQEIARIAAGISGSKSVIATLNHGPKNQIDTSKLRALGMTFGGGPLLERTIGELVAAAKAG
ncbi:MAG: NAD(P)-dependent oxidoreductase [Planctomycetota bacterium]|nr:NAD(P)-dependent oxidoreductase [Planctomycetota bacterium]